MGIAQNQHTCYTPMPSTFAPSALDAERKPAGMSSTIRNTSTIHNTPCPGADQDKELMQRAQGGDRDAFDALWKKYHQLILARCLRCMDFRHDDAEDAAAEAFEQAWIKIATYKFKSPPQAWLLLIAKNQCLQNIRGGKSKRDHEMPLETEDYVSALADTRATANPAEDVLKQIWEHIERRIPQLLTLPQRQICRLAYQQQMTSEEIARVLEMNPNTVRSHLSDPIRPKVRLIMAELDIQFPAALQGHVLAKIAKEGQK